MTASSTALNRSDNSLSDLELLSTIEPFFDRLGKGIAVFDRSRKLIRCNATWIDFIVRYTDTTCDAILPGIDFFTMIPGTESGMTARIARALAGETFHENEVPLVSTSGVSSWWDMILSPLVADGVITGFIMVATDTTERVIAHRQLERHVTDRTRELQLLLNIAHDVAATLELGPLAGLILDRVKGVVDYVGAAMFLLDDNDGLNLLRYQGPLPQHTLAWRWSLSTHAHAEAVVRRGEPVIIADTHSSDPLARSFLENSARDLGSEITGIGTWMGVPIAIGERVIGMLAVETNQPGAYTRRHAELLLAVARQAAIAVENARLYGQARDLAALEERQKLARELHDSVSQALYGIGLGARTARTLLDRDPPKAAEPLDYVIQLAEAGLTEMRALIFELRPDSLATEGLVGLLEKQAAALRVRYNITVTTEFGPEPTVSLAVKESLYRIAQEALHNIAKHARASAVMIRLEGQGDDILLDIADDGVGFDPTGNYPGHLGLRSMRERSARQGAVLEIESAPGHGSRLRVRIPVER